jgi:hypothetical protein
MGKKPILKIITISSIALILVLAMAFIGIPHYNAVQADKKLTLMNITGQVVRESSSKYWLGDACSVDSYMSKAIPFDGETITYDGYCVRVLKLTEQKINEIKTIYSTDAEILSTTTESLTDSEKIDYVDGFREGMYLVSNNVCISAYMCNNENGIFTKGISSPRSHMIDVINDLRAFHPIDQAEIDDLTRANLLGYVPPAKSISKGMWKAFDLCESRIRSTGILFP